MTIAAREREALNHLERALSTLVSPAARGWGWTDPRGLRTDIAEAATKLGLQTPGTPLRGYAPRARAEAVALLAETVGHLNFVTKRHVLAAIASLTI